ncbi:ABC transporter substrate-binding protein [Paracoccus denitrificans]|jgi:iron(III) transport system substrate-binding protein|nr:ABC transporter substrate-binding protein [Paracoccus denitrificans]MBB4627944.1 iron(III) transport system substrate-binding protein [Paracoccus denitrificans]MCU7428525.1 extracellular solute-binding protein [Paracoccus denitrificans]UPV95436.1 extracellular solute-binding protein [Paracoccus denitrificans]WQO32499.1 extracellular solute-binding protein [Paracoccus denitrificans]SDI62388.1 iron(III) transport system substrate-binding protein [Paracoccus denitrificans]
MRLIARLMPAIATALALWPGPASAQVTLFPAPAGDGRELSVYSSLDDDLAAPLVAAFQNLHPGVTVRYENLLTTELHDRIVAETQAGGGTADFAFSSAMDLQVKLANDGFARPVETPHTRGWPGWANWRDTAYALTFEPAVFAYHKPSFAGREPPATRADLMQWMAEHPDEAQGRIGTYDVSRSGVGYLFLARDQELYPGIWSVVQAMGRAGVQQFPTSAELLERIADGRLRLGYNLLGSYASDWARRHPDVGVILPRDFTVVVSRVALVPAAARQPGLGADFLAFLMSPEGQGLLSRTLRLSAVSLEVAGQPGPAGGMQDLAGLRLKPVPVSPGLLAYLDQATRAKLLARWNKALAGE